VLRFHVPTHVPDVKHVVLLDVQHVVQHAVQLGVVLVPLQLPAPFFLFSHLLTDHDLPHYLEEGTRTRTDGPVCRLNAPGPETYDNIYIMMIYYSVLIIIIFIL
jgi:hypothetical protein